ncbi:hypothetical protein ACM46_13225 [Chryseobacterium angstadtii]|uniref:DUF6265 domain-containing protein n=1 Tax=Chryseobacterium angstadtii TaxID=558151 RepID=A0A0J7IFN7_9FLAO|nr:DUF6265 family protein [Chryseobacterium angstadtii]KMQ65248.1 hypothetical protein ACM46_13225 [Chryseobacterium angstadtii]
MKTKLILSAIGLAVLSAWTAKQSEIKKLEWLLGTWETKTPKGSLYETWTRKSETELQGKSYYLNKKDTIFSETVRLVEKDKKLHYMVSVKGQHGELPVDFVSTPASTPTSLVFENLQNDFPQTITYKKIRKDSLLAEISGTMNGKKGKQAFPMRKIK